jgi:hypothetical protein
MKLFKSVDVTVQAILLLVWLLIFLLRPDFFLYFYFIIGGWQLLSCLAHWVFRDKYYPAKDRKCFLLFFAATIILGLIGIAGFSLIFYLLIFYCPLIAVWYCSICYKEVKIYRQRAWIQLK